MRAIYLITVLTLIVQGGHMGSRMVASLFAIELGANPFLIGALISAYSVFPLLLGVYSGRLSDRFGSRRRCWPEPRCWRSDCCCLICGPSSRRCTFPQR